MNKNMFPKLFEPLTIKKTTFRNRIFAAPIQLLFPGEGQWPRSGVFKFFAERAAGGHHVLCRQQGRRDCQYGTSAAQ